MKKIILYVLIGLVILIGGFFLLNNYIYVQKQGDQGFQKDYKNISYIIEGQTIGLVNGYSEVETVTGSASKTITRYFGNEAEGDINGDGISDIAFLLTQESGGSGTFYYLVVGLKTDTGYEGTNAIFLGDRIAPQPTQISSGEILVNYADRKPGEPMTSDPSVGVSRYFKLEDGKLVEQMDYAEFGSSIVFVINQKVKFSDGLIVMLKEINDSRCKQGVVCVWAGELSPLFVVEMGSNSKEIRLGTVNNKKVEEIGYVFELKASTETTATISVVRSATVSGGCYIGGCSSQICSDKKDVVSTCEYTEAYACYNTAKCERQTDGKCGWTQTPGLVKCLNDAK